MYIERICKKHGKKQYETTLVRESYRDKGKVKHRTIANLSKLPIDIIQNIETFFNNKIINFCKLDAIKISNSREYGASNAFMNMAKQLDLDKIIYSRKVSWQQDVLAMIVGRLVYQGSKLHLTHLHHDSILWKLVGFKDQGCPDVAKHCYAPLDRLLERQKAIQTELAKRHLSNGSIILYDITSSYLEVEYEQSKLADFGYSRDNKRGHEQIVIGLLANEAGCPFAIEIFRGNTSDQTTVLGQAKKLANDYQVKNIIFVSDRGMLTPKRINEVNKLGYKTLTVLSRLQLRELGQRGIINPNQFTNNDKVGKFFTWGFKNNKLTFQIEEAKVIAVKAFDGCYVVRTDSDLNKGDAVREYKELAHIERAFRNIKTMSLEIRPIYHQLAKRIKAHVFLCMLAYYIEWNAIQSLKPLFAQDGKGAKKHLSFTRIIERLKSIRIQDCSLSGIQMPGVITTPDNEQQKILDLLKRSAYSGET